MERQHFLYILGILIEIRLLKTSPETKGNAINKRWSSSETRVLISCYQEHVDPLKKAKSPQTKKAIWEAMFDQFQETCQEQGIESGKSLAQLKEKWKSLFDKYKAINGNDKATGRGRLTFEFFEEMDSFLGSSDKVNPKFVSETVISNENADEEPSLSSRSATPKSLISRNLPGARY